MLFWVGAGKDVFCGEPYRETGGWIMKRFCLVFSALAFVVLLSGCVPLIVGGQFTKMGTDYITAWVSDNVPIGATEDEVLQLLGEPQSRYFNVWIYRVPKNFYKSLQNSTVAVFFSQGKVITWLGYYYPDDHPVGSRAETSYENISMGATQDEVLKGLGEPVYQGARIWLFWKDPEIKYSFWSSPPVANALQAIVFDEGKVVGILCFTASEYYGTSHALWPGMIIKPTGDVLKQGKK